MADTEHTGAIPPAPAEEEVPFGMTRLYHQGWKTFLADLPQLMNTHAGQWVAYSGTQRLGFGKTQLELLQKFMAKGFKAEDLVVTTVEPEPEYEVEYSDWYEQDA